MQEITDKLKADNVQYARIFLPEDPKELFIALNVPITYLEIKIIQYNRVIGWSGL